MVNEQEFFRKHFAVRRGIVTTVDNSTESHTTGSGGNSRYDPILKTSHVSAVNITTTIIRKSRIWVQFDGETAPNIHLDFENDEFVCAPNQKVSVLSLKASGEVLAIGNNSSRRAIQLCDVEELVISLLIDEGHALPIWWLQRKGDSTGPFDFLNKVDNAYRRSVDRGAAKLFGIKEDDEQYVFHYGKPNATETAKYWLGAVGPALLISVVVYAQTAAALSESIGDILSAIAGMVAAAAVAVTGFFIRKFMQRNTAYGRFVATGSVDRSSEWNAYMKKVNDIIEHAGSTVLG